MTREVRVSKRRTSIKGLEKYSAYTVRVVAVTVDGLGVSSRLVKLITRQDGRFKNCFVLKFKATIFVRI